MVVAVPARVAVIGAAGIGKHHVKWWMREGAHVTAIAGSTPDSAARAAKGVHALCGFDGRAHSDISRMLDAERPEIVDVCSPPNLHAAHVRAALEAGCHVLCEKPFVYHPEDTPAAMMREARALVALAETLGCRLGVCTQYAAGAALFEAMWQRFRPGEILRRYAGRLEAPARNHAPDPVRIWADLGAHPISVLLRIMGGQAAPDWDSLRTHFDGCGAVAELSVKTGRGPVACTFITRNTSDATNVRHFEYNDFAFTIQAHCDAQGDYCARIRTPGETVVETDLMRLTIRQFLDGRPVAGMAESLTNLEWMLRIQESAAAV